MNIIVEENGQWVIYGPDGKEVGRFDDPIEADKAFPDAKTQADFPDWQPGQPIPAETISEEEVGIASPSEPLLATYLHPYLDQWNAWFGKDYGTLSEKDAASARAYEYLNMGTMGTQEGFQNALSMYSNWVNSGGASGPAPNAEAIKAWYAQQPVALPAPGAITGAPMGHRALEEFAPPTEAPAPNNPLGQAIWAQTANLDPVTRDRVRSAMLLGAGLEGGGVVGPWGAGDGGTAFGPYQIHGLTQTEAEDPARAVQFMLFEHVGGEATYIKAVQAIPDEVWNSDPQGAATLAVANAERVGGWTDTLTVEQAVTIYGGRDRLTIKGQETGGGGAVPGTAGGGLTSVEGGPTYPTPGTEEEAWGNLTAAQQQRYYDVYAATGMPMEYYTAAIMGGQDPKTYWDARKVQELNTALDEKRMTGAEFDIAYAFHLGAADIEGAHQLGVPILTWGQVIHAGGTAGEIRQAVAMGIDPMLYHEYGQILSPEDFIKADLLNIPLPKMVEQKQLSLAEAQATDEFNQQWATQYHDLPAEIGMDPDIKAYMDYRKEQERQDYVAQRIVDINKPAPKTAVPGGNGTAPAAPVAPVTPALPDFNTLIEQGVREGVIAQYVTGRGPSEAVPYGGMAEYGRRTANAVAGPMGIGPVGGAKVAKPGGYYGYSEGGNISAAQALARAYMAKPSVIPEGYTSEQWQAILRQRYPGAAPEEPLEEPESDLERLNRGTKLAAAKKKKPLS